MIERQIHLSSGGGAALKGYDGLLRFSYTKNRGIYALRVEADGEWQGMTLRAFWHLPDGNAAPSTLVMDALWGCPALITAVPEERGASPLRAPMAPTSDQRGRVLRGRKLRHGGWPPAAARPAPPPPAPAGPSEGSGGQGHNRGRSHATDDPRGTRQPEDPPALEPRQSTTGAQGRTPPGPKQTPRS